MKQKILTCAGYYGTGSSAITDLLSEFDNVHYMGDFEFRFVQDPGGISDLDYNINENNHRHNSGHALKRYKNNIDFLSGNIFIKKYERFFGGQFKKISYEYINSLTLFCFKGYWHQDVIDKGYWFYVLDRFLEKMYNKLIVPIFFRKYRNDSLSIHLLKNEITYVPIFDPEKFYILTRNYIDNLFSVVNSDNKEFIMVDQLVPPTNCNRYLRYFNNLKIIAVDRDPRDLYILEKMIWKGGVVPTDSPSSFCKWFKTTRFHRDIEIDDTSKVLRINLEDLIYHYSESVSNICSFLGINQTYHILPKSRFDPNVSINNTRLWEKYPHLSSEISVIQQELNKFCYKNYVANPKF